MNWNTQFAQMMGDATEMMYGSHFLNATEAMQRAFIGAPAAKPAASSSIHSSPQCSTDVLDALLPERCANTAAVKPPAPQAPGSFERIALMLGGALHHYWLYVPPGAQDGASADADADADADAAADTDTDTDADADADAAADASTPAPAPMPLVLMLHGCSQDAAEFAAATEMNAAAAAANALVLYPEQARGANAGGCWNWFEPENQHHGQGELGVMVAMLRDVMARHPVDAQRVYAAGISAGGAMAALLAREYPELFAAVGVHSGLRAGAADNMMAALSAMNNGAKLGTSDQPPTHISGKPQPALIVFHGDADTTVDPKNGEQLVQAALQTALGDKNAALHETQQGQSDAGQRFTRNLYRASDSAPVLVEHWLLHNGGHAWSGGSAKVGQTDPKGVSATQEMLRFFLEHPQKH